MNEDEELKKLFSISKEEYGDKYQDVLFEQYKLFLQMIDNLNNRRSLANSFFLSVNTGLISALGILANIGLSNMNEMGWWIVVGVIGGFLFSYTWIRTVTSYSQLSKGKWAIIHEIEKRLPLSLHQVEWKILGEGKDKSKYKPLTDVEKYIPVVFMTLYVIVGIMSVLIKFKIITA